MIAKTILPRQNTMIKSIICIPNLKSNILYSKNNNFNQMNNLLLQIKKIIPIIHNNNNWLIYSWMCLPLIPSQVPSSNKVNNKNNLIINIPNNNYSSNRVSRTLKISFFLNLENLLIKIKIFNNNKISSKKQKTQQNKVTQSKKKINNSSSR